MDKNLKIAVYVDNYIPLSQTFINEYLQQINNMHEVLVICSEKTSNDISVPVVMVRKPKLKKFKSIRTLKNYFYDKEYSSSLIEVLSKFNPDFIHCQFGTMLPWLYYNLGLKLRKRILTQYWGYDASSALKRRHYRRCLKAIYKNMDIPSVFVSKALKRSFESYVTLDSKSTTVIHHGIDPNKFRRKNRKKKREVVFLQVSRLVEKKGVIYTIMAFEKFMSKDVIANAYLKIVGDGPMMNVLKDKVMKSRYASHIELVGAINPDKIFDYYEKASFFLHHSITASDGDMEGVPTSIMEAMAMELPVLVSDHSGIVELVKNGVNGFVIPEKNIDQYVDKMIQVLSWPYLKENADKIKEYFNVNTYPTTLINFALEEINS